MIRFRVYGEPVPQGSMKAFRKKGGPGTIVTHNNEAKLRPWREAVAAEAREWRKTHPGHPLDEPVAVALTFYVTRPASLPKWRWLPWTGRDLDKQVRSVLDALKAIVIRDDSRVVDLAACKRFAGMGLADDAPGVVVTVVPLGQWERELTPDDDEEERRTVAFLRRTIEEREGFVAT